MNAHGEQPRQDALGLNRLTGGLTKGTCTCLQGTERSNTIALNSELAMDLTTFNTLGTCKAQQSMQGHGRVLITKLLE